MRNYRKRVRKFAEGGKVGDDYNTPLEPAQEELFQKWKGKNAPDDDFNYGMRGTGAQRDRAGHWVEGEFVPPANK